MSRGIIEVRQRVLDLRRGVAKKEKIYFFMQEVEELRVKDRNILPFRRKKAACIRRRNKACLSMPQKFQKTDLDL